MMALDFAPRTVSIRCQLCFPMQKPRSVDSVALLSRGDFTVFQKHPQKPLLVQGVAECGSSLGFRQDFILMLFYPRKISVNQRLDLQLPPVLPFSGLQPRQLIVNFINSPDLL